MEDKFEASRSGTGLESRRVLDGRGKEIDRSFFWEGGCGVFAVTLARALRGSGLEARVAVVSMSRGDAWSDEFDYEFTHVIVCVSDGYLDVKGWAESPFAVMKRLGLAETEREINVHTAREPDEFEAIFMGDDDDKPLYAVDDEGKDWALRLVQAQPRVYRLGESREEAR